MQAAFRQAGEEKFYNQQQAMAAKAGGSHPAAPGGDMRMGFARAGGPPAGAGSAYSGRNGDPQRPNSDARPNQGARGRRVALWVLGEDKALHPLVVKLGLTDGVQTEIDPGKLKEGDKIVIGVESSQARTATGMATRPPGFGGPGMGGMGRGMR